MRSLPRQALKSHKVFPLRAYVGLKRLFEFLSFVLKIHARESVEAVE
jgi:hypothetical protein